MKAVENKINSVSSSTRGTAAGACVERPRARCAGTACGQTHLTQHLGGQDLLRYEKEVTAQRVAETYKVCGIT